MTREPTDSPGEARRVPWWKYQPGIVRPAKRRVGWWQIPPCLTIEIAFGRTPARCTALVIGFAYAAGMFVQSLANDGLLPAWTLKLVTPIVLTLVLVPMFVLPQVQLARCWQRVKGRVAEYCPRCFYSMKDLEGRRACPECGELSSPASRYVMWGHKKKEHHSLGPVPPGVDPSVWTIDQDQTVLRVGDHPKAVRPFARWPRSPQLRIALVLLTVLIAWTAAFLWEESRFTPDPLYPVSVVQRFAASAFPTLVYVVLGGYVVLSLGLQVLTIPKVRGRAAHLCTTCLRELDDRADGEPCPDCDLRSSAWARWWSWRTVIFERWLGPRPDPPEEENQP